MNMKPLPESLTAIMNGAGVVAAPITLTLSDNAYRLFVAFAAAEGRTIEAELSAILEARAQEDLQTMTMEEIADLSGGPRYR